jgi:hypothetical protein
MTLKSWSAILIVAGAWSSGASIQAQTTTSGTATTPTPTPTMVPSPFNSARAGNPLSIVPSPISPNPTPLATPANNTVIMTPYGPVSPMASDGLSASQRSALLWYWASQSMARKPAQPQPSAAPSTSARSAVPRIGSTPGGGASRYFPLHPYEARPATGSATAARFNRLGTYYNNNRQSR